MIDFERGAKATGTKFYYLTGQDAVREWNLCKAMIDFHMERGYEFIIPPYMVNRKTCEQAGILPRFEDEYYQTKNEGFILVPTAETSLIGYHSNEILNAEDLPIKYVAFSPCFRREAGAAGKRDKGLRRVHQFHKIELFVICEPEQSYDLHEKMTEQVEELLDRLYIRHRRTELSESDRPQVAAKTYDIEVQAGEEWLEVSSISNTEDRQAKLAQIRYRPQKNKKPVKCHLLNGSGVALPRLQLALKS